MQFDIKHMRKMYLKYIHALNRLYIIIIFKVKVKQYKHVTHLPPGVGVTLIDDSGADRVEESEGDSGEDRVPHADGEEGVDEVDEEDAAPDSL